MIIDIAGIELTPGNKGKDCLGNGSHFNEDGSQIACCCDECDYMMCCFQKQNLRLCRKCDDEFCPRKPHKKRRKIHKGAEKKDAE